MNKIGTGQNMLKPIVIFFFLFFLISCGKKGDPLVPSGHGHFGIADLAGRGLRCVIS
ncbi:MAG: hypothetical protein AAB035_05745 [Nitrospirota bacterium]